MEMSAAKRPRLEEGLDPGAGLPPLSEVVELSKEQLTNLIENETTHPNTRSIWKVYLRILKHDFLTKSAVEFWGDHLRRMFKFIKMSVNSQTLFLRMFTRIKKWHICKRIG
jgi:hypothetical protein